MRKKAYKIAEIRTHLPSILNAKEEESHLDGGDVG
ncbi:MAG: hypothetical protein CM15mP1_3760 [Methanobacteriota archaeon]|nr:MAG: hypothetical protein CM15mP1_3760 [Euryarchaeota archaeon]